MAISNAELTELKRGMNPVTLASLERQLGTSGPAKRLTPNPPKATPSRVLPDRLACGHDGCDLETGCVVPGGRWTVTWWGRLPTVNTEQGGKRSASFGGKAPLVRAGARLAIDANVPRLRCGAVDVWYWTANYTVPDVDGLCWALKHLVDGWKTVWDEKGKLTTAGVFPDDAPWWWPDLRIRYGGVDIELGDRVELTVVSLGIEGLPQGAR